MTPRATLACHLFAAGLAAACTPDLPTAAAPVDAAAARGGNGTPAYSSVDVGSLVGNYSSTANDVNDDGDVVGSSCCGVGSGAFAIVAGVLTPLPGNAFDARAISNGTPRYVAGSAAGQPVRWSIVNTVSSQPTALQLSGASRGAALGVNDVGAAVGSADAQAAIWNADGNLAVAFLPQGFVSGEGRDINNAGHAVFVFNTSGPVWSSGRAYLRLASGALVFLPPLAGDVTSYANDISEVVNGLVYVAGTTRGGPFAFRSVRWTVDVGTGGIVSTLVRSENSHALGVSTFGATTGFLETNAERTPKFTAFLWRGGEFLSLSAPKGGKDGRSWAMSPSGAFIAGDAAFGTTRRAVRWTIHVP